MVVGDRLCCQSFFQDDRERIATKDGGFPLGEQLPCAGFVARIERRSVVTEHENQGLLLLLFPG